jgi:uncharacterized RDD family membrane protein YckC
MAAGAAVGPGGRPLAEWWQRLVAVIIDGVIINIVGAIAGRVLPGVLGLVVTLGLGWLYFTYFHGSTGQTPGKMVMKIKTVSSATGDVIGMNGAAIRSAIYPLAATFTCGLLGIVDGIMLLTNPQRQSLHDKVANTLVVTVDG